ncbi:hypothetical protein WH285_13835 [Acinetobacter johnsonii]|uniref:hypothetical protein n=1 Tax=Acinetobacter johnsonii TaxID=40214 RepID=UPI0030AB8E7E
MFTDIKNAYEDYLKKYKRHPTYISMGRDHFDTLNREDTNPDIPTFLGMKALVTNDTTTEFNLFEEKELDDVLFEYHNSRDKMKSFEATRLLPAQMLRVAGDNKKLNLIDIFDEIVIKSDVIRAYERHKNMKNMVFEAKLKDL